VRERYNVKKVSDFPSPAEMSLTKLSLAGNIVRESLVSDIPAGDRKIANIFYSVGRKGRKYGLLSVIFLRAGGHSTSSDIELLLLPRGMLAPGY